MLTMALRIAAGMLALSLALAARAQEMAVIFGTHSGGPGVGFSIANFDTANGHLTEPQLIM